MIIELIKVIKTVELDDAEATKEEFDKIIDFAEKMMWKLEYYPIDMRPLVVL